MPDEDTGSDMSEMRTQVDTEQDAVAEGMSEMQDYIVGDTAYEEVTEAKYRVTMKDFGAMDNEVLFVEYYDLYPSAVNMFYKLSNATEFIKHHDRAMVFVDMEKAHRGTSEIFWELIKREVVYDDGE